MFLLLPLAVLRLVELPATDDAAAAAAAATVAEEDADAVLLLEAADLTFLISLGSFTPNVGIEEVARVATTLP